MTRISPDFDFLLFLGSAPGVPHTSFGELKAETATVPEGPTVAHSPKTGPRAEDKQHQGNLEVLFMNNTF